MAIAKSAKVIQLKLRKNPSNNPQVNPPHVSKIASADCVASNAGCSFERLYLAEAAFYVFKSKRYRARVLQPA
jgi:hypothetical protein